MTYPGKANLVAEVVEALDALLRVANIHEFGKAKSDNWLAIKHPSNCGKPVLTPCMRRWQCQ